MTALADLMGIARVEQMTLELVRWFQRRYPTVKARLAYARRAYRRWLRASGSR